MLNKNKLIEFKELTVMADFCSSGIWKHETGGMIEFEDLNLPLDLIKEFEDWIEFYDCECHDIDLYFIEKMADKLNKQGRILAKKLKVFLPNIKIFYRGENSNDMLKEEEIKLDDK
jgi:hypothetical protein